MLRAERLPPMLNLGDLVKEFGVFAALFAPASMYTFATADLSGLPSAPWFVVAKVVFINVVIPGAFALWRVLRSRQQRDAHVEAIDALVTIVEQMTPLLPESAQADVARAVTRIQRKLHDKESSRKIKDLVRGARRRRRRQGGQVPPGPDPRR